MRHRRVGRKLKREKGPRAALLRSLMRSIVIKNAIVTTQTKAKAVRPVLERLVTRAKHGALADYRLVAATIGKDAALRLKKDIVPKLSNRHGGYVRIIKYGVRRSDSAHMARIGFVD